MRFVSLCNLFLSLFVCGVDASSTVDGRAVWLCPGVARHVDEPVVRLHCSASQFFFFLRVIDACFTIFMGIINVNSC